MATRFPQDERFAAIAAEYRDALKNADAGGERAEERLEAARRSLDLFAAPYGVGKPQPQHYRKRKTMAMNAVLNMEPDDEEPQCFDGCCDEECPYHGETGAEGEVVA